eukprot:TRINITY_DN2307_c0_g1_i1.p1 TRINITY_DN2307_c0_g1~~TRINITY_DN2307_c0_g1_i1.p1  ORF type:complete len:413 (-),score=45.92 TRINITY_DN2307_c0_g1_i1:403-1641(-)
MRQPRKTPVPFLRLPYRATLLFCLAGILCTICVFQLYNPIRGNNAKFTISADTESKHIVLQTLDILSDRTSEESSKSRVAESTPTRPSFLYYGDMIDEPRVKCSGLNHQTSSLRCALEEASLLNRTFVLPDKMCLQARHNEPTGLGLPNEGLATTVPLASLFDLDALNRSLLGGVVSVSSDEWLQLKSERGHLFAESNASLPYSDLAETPEFQEAEVIHRNAGDFWLTLCWTRQLDGRPPFQAPKYALPLYDAAAAMARKMGDFDFVHVRRGDKVKLTHKKTIYPHLDRDTRPAAMLRKLRKWIPKGRIIYLATDETSKGFFDPLLKWYDIRRPVDFLDILKPPVVTTNYHLFAVEKLLSTHARVHVGTYRGESASGYVLCEDPRAGVAKPVRPVMDFETEVAETVSHSRAL